MPEIVSSSTLADCASASCTALDSLPNFAPQPHHRQGDEGDTEQNNHRQAPIEPKEQDDSANQCQHLPQQGHYIVGNGGLQLADIVGDARHDFAGAIDR